jgi:hypothetical protein
MRTTHTFAEIAVSEEAYHEISTLLAEAGYHHAFIDGAIDMNGIALTRKGKRAEASDETKETAVASDEAKETARTWFSRKPRGANVVLRYEVEGSGE